MARQYNDKSLIADAATAYADSKEAEKKEGLNAANPKANAYQNYYQQALTDLTGPQKPDLGKKWGL